MNWLIGFFSPLWRTSTQRAALRLAPLAILLVAAWLRIHALGQQSLWYDEGNSLRLAQRAIPDLIEAASRDIHPPAYYLMLKGWLVLTGDSEFALRMLSALAGMLTVACTMVLGQRLFSRSAGLMSAAIVAVNTFSIYYGQETRMYAMLQLASAASMWLFVRWLSRPRWSRAWPLTLVNAAGLYIQYWFPWVMIAQGIMLLAWLVWRWRGATRVPASAVAATVPTGRAVLLGFIALNLITVALFAPQIPTALRQLSGWGQAGARLDPALGWSMLWQWLVFGRSAVGVPWWPYAFMALFALAALLPDWVRGQRVPSAWRRALPVVWLLAFLVPFTAFGLFREANFKFLLPAQVAAALLLGRGMWLLWELGSPNLLQFPDSLPRYAAMFGLLYFFNYSYDALPLLYTDPRFTRPDYRAIAALINRNPRAGDVIMLNAPNQIEVFGYYYLDRLQGTLPIVGLPQALTPNDADTQAQIDALIRNNTRIYAIYYGESERDPTHVVERWLAQHAFEINAAWFGDVRLVQYATFQGGLTPVAGFQPRRFGPAITLQSAALNATTRRTGELVAVALGWQTDRKLEQRYKVFLHLYNDADALVAQRDAEPNNYLAPTNGWSPDQPIADFHGIVIPPTLAPGRYQLVVGLYDSADPKVRLPVSVVTPAVGTGPDSRTDTLTLATITVTSD